MNKSVYYRYLSFIRKASEERAVRRELHSRLILEN